VRKARHRNRYCPTCGIRRERYFSPETMAVLLDCSIHTVRKMIRRREISYVKINRMVRIPSSELEKIGNFFPNFNGDSIGRQ